MSADSIAPNVTAELQVEERFRKLVEALPDAIFVVCEERIVFVNPSAAKLLGAQEPEQIIGKNLSEIVHPESLASIKGRIRESYRTGVASPPMEHVLIALDGSRVETESASIPISWKGSPAIEAIARDIRPRKRAEARLQEYERVVEGLEEMIVVVDRDYRYVLANRAYLNYRSLERQQVIGRAVPEIMGKDVFESVIRRKVDEAFQGRVVEYELKFTYPRLGERNLLISYFPIEGAGGIDRIACVLQDVTERKRAEQALRDSEDRYRDLVEHSQDLLCTHDLSGTLLSCNPAPARILGYEVAELLKIPMRELVAPEYREQFDQYLSRIKTVGLDQGLMAVVSRSGERRIWEYNNTLRTEGVPAPVVRGMAHDITERKRAEKSLKLFRTLVDQSNDAFEVFDPETLRFIDVNGRACLDLGYTRDELLAMRVYDIDPIASKSRSAKVGEDLRNSGSAIFESIHRRKDGTTFPVEVSVKQVHLDRMYRIAVVRDITERMRTEKSMKLFRVLIDESNDAIEVIDPDTLRYMDANGRACLELGYSREELLSMSVHDIDANPDKSIFLRVDGELRSSKYAVFETIHRRKDGSTFPVEVSVKQVHLDRIYRISVVRNITARKRVEQELRQAQTRTESVLEGVADTHILFDRGWHYLYVNRAAVLAMGRAREQILGRTLWELYPDIVGTELDRQYRRAMEERVPVAFDFYHSALNTWWDNRFYPVPEGLSVFATNITERKRAEQAVQESQAALARVARVATMGELTASIAHEISQPLAAVVANASASRHWLDAHPPELDEARESVTRAIHDANRASGVIKRIRALLQKQPPQLRPLNGNEVIREVVRLADSELLKDRVTVKTELAADIPAVLGDRVQIQQVLLNLILNAIDAMSMITDRRRELFIKSAKHADGTLIQIQDSGKGVDPEQVDRIFEPFFTTKPQGIGLGLSISRSIVEAHSGRLWVTRGSPHGTIFQFTLPAAGLNP